MYALSDLDGKQIPPMNPQSLCAGMRYRRRDLTASANVAVACAVVCDILQYLHL